MQDKKPGLLRLILIISVLTAPGVLRAQFNLKGRILTADSLKPIPGANIVLKGSTIGTTSDNDGQFSLGLPAGGGTLLVSHVSFEDFEVTVTKEQSGFEINLTRKAQTSGGVTVRAARFREKQKESPLTVESQGIQAIKETPASDFYEGLGHLKGVDVTAASLGFRIVNTRGFNSTSPVRSLQLIDGVDNQAPGLNFSLGNFLGASEIDIMNNEIVVGAASAFYGPNAFNGVISMTTKDPWRFKGLTVQVKFGERQLMQTAVRYAKVWKDKKQKDRFAFKVNAFYLRAYDWVADNADPSTESKANQFNWGGYDAVNRYGDENLGLNTNDATGRNAQIQVPGLGLYHREGYWEKDLVNYNTRNFKSNLMGAWKMNSKNELQYAISFGTGTTVYQGDNRYSLNDILFFQNRLEWKFKNGFVRVYATNEDAGNTYDAVFTAFLMQRYAKKDGDWSADYYNNWYNTYSWKVKALPGYPQNPFDPTYFTKAQEVMNKYADSLVKWHAENRARSNKWHDYQGLQRIYPTFDRFEPGTARFDSLKNAITSKKSFGEGGSGFFDRSALYHIQGQKSVEIKNVLLTVGFSGRIYRPYSQGTIFLDTGKARIRNREFGVYAGMEKRLIRNRLKFNLTARLDKNQNFDFLVSPAASLVYTKDKKNYYRLSFSSAIRNPTLQDQYLYYNVGRAILLGNLKGFNHVLSPESVYDFMGSQKLSDLKYFNIKPVRPERVRSLEAGYKGFLFKDRLNVDASAYFSWYKYFIGYKVAVEANVDTVFKRIMEATAYRVAANTEDLVTTMGFSVGTNYFFGDFYSLNANYSFNELDRRGSTDPIIPAFNTPKHKYNIGISGSDIQTTIGWLKAMNKNWKEIHLKNCGFNVNYKWVQGYRFEGSPQFTGDVPTYYMIDAQVTQKFVKQKTTLKIGASNLLNRMQFQVYGGPRIGRMAYISLLYEP